MKKGKDNEMKLALSILKGPKNEYNSRNLAKLIGISPMGALKIAKKLEKENIVKSKQVGKSKIYSIELDNDYSRHYIQFLLKKEAEQSEPYIKRWIRELKKIRDAKTIVLFGSVLSRGKQARDIDALIVVDKKKFDKVKKEIDGINNLNEKKIHPIYQTKKDLEEHIKKENKIILNAIKGIVVFGEDILIPLLKK